MHTLIVIAAGIAVLVTTLLIGRWTGLGVADAALVFIPIWFALALLNLWIGVSKAGYSVAEEIPVLLLAFSAPALAALVVWWHVHSGG
ncbi:hypothetical protein [Paraburkholderia sediminicola]|uniref:hypothetical protein n=1 Tax=Paraburkholderia sediminicola TaxID=458836 RepID=UPI0038B736D6